MDYREMGLTIYLLTMLGFLIVACFRSRKRLKEIRKADQQEKDHLRKV